MTLQFLYLLGELLIMFFDIYASFAGLFYLYSQPSHLDLVLFSECLDLGV